MFLIVMFAHVRSDFVAGCCVFVASSGSEMSVIKPFQNLYDLIHVAEV